MLDSLTTMPGLPAEVPTAETPTGEQLTSVRLLRGLRLAALIITAAVLVALDLPALLAHLSIYPVPGVQVCAYLLLAVIVLVEGVLAVINRSWRVARWPAVTLVLLVSAAATTTAPAPDPTGYANWCYDVIGWFGVVLLFDQSLLMLLAFLAAHLALTVGHLLASGSANGSAVLGLMITAVCLSVFQTSLAATAGAMRRVASSMAAAIEEAERVHALEATARQVQMDRRRRYAELATGVRPLLTGLADGVLDPADERVRRRCAIEAARIRRLLAETDDTTDKLLHELRACVDVAERRGVLVQLAVCGTPPRLATSVRRALTDAPVQALAAARDWARVTVVGADSSVTVSVVSDGGFPIDPLPPAHDVHVSTICEDGRSWTEATWHRPM